MITHLNRLEYIRLQVEIKLFPTRKPIREFHNYFRTFKRPEESLEDDSFCSPFFANGATLTLGDYYGDRANAMLTILRELQTKSYISMYLSYDFRFVKPNTEYDTAGAFQEIRQLLENALWGTDLYLFFMVSHFNQLIGKSEETKPEHYHVLLRPCKMKADFLSAANKLSEHLKKNSIFDPINIDVSN